jgi:hypothetical protein
MNGVTMDSTKLLTEKLSLSRELAILKPELEHLRSQATYQQTVLSEKLALQRQVSTLEVEIETEKRASKRAMDKNKNKEREVELQQQVDDLQKELTMEKRDREKARKEAERDLESEKRALKRVTEKSNNTEREDELQQQLDDLQAEYTREKRESEKLRKELEKDLEVERRASKRASEKIGTSKERDVKHQEQLDELQTKLAQEKREKDKVRKEAEKDLNAAETRRTVLESQLDQMRTKLRATKEELKECQTELGEARAASAQAGTSSMKADAPAKNSRKRAAVEMSTDGAIGTPDGVAIRGQRPAVKRGRVDQTMLGEKSMFSITPFLNKTINLALDSPAQGEPERTTAAEQLNVGVDEVEAPLEAANEEDQVPIETSPSALSKTKVKSKPASKKALVEKKVLLETKQGMNTRNPAPKKAKAIITLERVTEEDGDENEDPTQSLDDKIEKEKPATTKSFSKVQAKTVEEVEPKKKKRKLLGGGKTLFDEEDGEATKRPAKVNLGPPRLLGKGELAGPKRVLKGGIGSASGFGTFSPLKKDRRGVGASFLA